MRCSIHRRLTALDNGEAVAEWNHNLFYAIVFSNELIKFGDQSAVVGTLPFQQRIGKVGLPLHKGVIYTDKSVRRE